jgi:uncharacterized protein YjbI with pentapeptide repeats
MTHATGYFWKSSPNRPLSIVHPKSSIPNQNMRSSLTTLPDAATIYSKVQNTLEASPSDWTALYTTLWELGGAEPLSETATDALIAYLGEQPLVSRAAFTQALALHLPQLLQHSFVYTPVFDEASEAPLSLATQVFYCYWTLLSYANPSPLNWLPTDEDLLNRFAYFLRLGQYYRLRLDHQCFDGAVLQQAHLKGADLQFASFRKAVLIDADLRGANLQDTNFAGANLSGALLNNANTRRTDFRAARLYKADMRHVHLNTAQVAGADLSGANLSQAFLSNMNLSEMDLQMANLNEADLSFTILMRANLSWVTCREAKMQGVVLSDAQLTKADLSGADLYQARLDNTDLFKANLDHADLREVDMRGANLRYASFREAKISDTLRGYAASQEASF